MEVILCEKVCEMSITRENLPQEKKEKVKVKKPVITVMGDYVKEKSVI